MLDSLNASIAVFAAAAVVIAVAGTFLARAADELADRTGLGEALIGTFLLAGATSLPDFAATLSAAVDGRGELAMSNVMGSMAANLAFLVLGDLVYRKANLEHAAASVPNLMQAVLLVALLAIPLIAMAVPDASLGGVHPATPLIVVGYVLGLRLVRGAQARPMWFPRKTRQTVEDRPAPGRRGGLLAAWAKFGALTTVTAVSGWWVMETAKGVTDHTALSDGVAGGLFTALATSSPELVTTIAAIRQGALTLAVSNIVGTNSFNVLVIAAADLGYPGSIYADISSMQLIWGLVTILMTAILLLGMLRRETYGIGRIGFESFLVLAVYAATLAAVVTMG
ncbi:MAG: sodium:calcium antiporter [Pseudomonadota bacterium]